jgi:Ca2+-binding EF-hand superfamily protein
MPIPFTIRHISTTANIPNTIKSTTTKNPCPLTDPDAVWCKDGQGRTNNYLVAKLEIIDPKTLKPIQLKQDIDLEAILYEMDGKNKLGRQLDYVTKSSTQETIGRTTTTTTSSSSSKKKHSSTATKKVQLIGKDNALHIVNVDPDTLRGFRLEGSSDGITQISYRMVYLLDHQPKKYQCVEFRPVLSTRQLTEFTFVPYQGQFPTTTPIHVYTRVLKGSGDSSEVIEDDDNLDEQPGDGKKKPSKKRLSSSKTTTTTSNSSSSSSAAPTSSNSTSAGADATATATDNDNNNNKPPKKRTRTSTKTKSNNTSSNTTTNDEPHTPRTKIIAVEHDVKHIIELVPQNHETRSLLKDLLNQIKMIKRKLTFFKKISSGEEQSDSTAATTTTSQPAKQPSEHHTNKSIRIDTSITNTKSSSSSSPSNNNFFSFDSNSPQWSFLDRDISWDSLSEVDYIDIFSEAHESNEVFVENFISENPSDLLGAEFTVSRQGLGLEFFSAADVNQDGELDEEELAHALTMGKIFFPLPPEMSKRIFLELDKNKNGKIDRGEFVAALRNKEQELIELFTKLDKNHDGYLDLQELRDPSFLTKMHIKEEQLLDFVRMVDSTSAEKPDNLVSLGEFLSTFTLMPSGAILERFLTHSIGMNNNNSSGSNNNTSRDVVLDVVPADR